MQSQERIEREMVDISQIGASLADQDVLVRARIHNTRLKGKQCFLVLRQRAYTIQVNIFYCL